MKLHFDTLVASLVFSIGSPFFIPHSFANNEKVPLYSAQAALIDSSEKTVGTVQLSETHKGIVLHIQAQGIPPGTYGIHFHENGKCEGPSFESAGGHFNPDQKQHGLKNPEGFHAGDLPNLIISKTGTSQIKLFTSSVTLKKGRNSLLKPNGTALIIHENQDDQKSSPSGGSGKRRYCGIIKKVELSEPIAPVAYKR